MMTLRFRRGRGGRVSALLVTGGLCICCVLGMQASATADSLPVNAGPVPAREVYIRPTGSQRFKLVADHTPVVLTVEAQRYDIRVEAGDGFFYRYTGERAGVMPGTDLPNIQMDRDLNWPRLTALIGFGAFLGCGSLGYALWQTRRRNAEVLQKTPKLAPMNVLQASGDSLGPRSRRLPTLIGMVVEAEGGALYHIVQQIGEGGMGVVFEATGAQDQKSVYAIKILFNARRQEEQLRRFEREVRICSQLNHPGIVKVFDWGMCHSLTGPEPESWLFMVMERVRGETMGALIEDRANRPAPLATWLQWFVDILRALRVAHAAGVVHRDLKPDNIMITTNGRIKLMDFGIAHRLENHSLTQTGQALGTPHYMSPEHLQATETTPASDIYSLGVIFYEAVAGQLPYEADALWALALQKITEPAISIGLLVPDLPAGLEPIIMKMLAPRLSNRYRNCDAVLFDLEPVVSRLVEQAV